MTYTSNLPAVVARLRAARFAGLIAAAEVYIGAMKEALRGGYVTGDFVTGFVMNSVTRTEPNEDQGGAYILVGTSVMYALWYEVGHFNIFRRQFTRVEKWMPVFLQTREQQSAAYLRAFSRVWGGSGGGGFAQRAASPRSPR